MTSGDRREGPDQGRHVLTGLEGPRRTPGADGPRSAGYRFRTAGRRPPPEPVPRSEAGGVDPVGRHHHLRLHPAPPIESVRRHPTRADHHGRIAGGPTDGPGEQRHLGALVPLGGVEEAQVVHRHHGGDRRPARHRVVGTVVDDRARGPDQGSQAHLLPDQAEGPGAGAAASRSPGATRGAHRSRSARRLHSTSPMSGRADSRVASWRMS